MALEGEGMIVLLRLGLPIPQPQTGTRFEATELSLAKLHGTADFIRGLFEDVKTGEQFAVSLA
jgi:hypothetical protein